MDSELLLQETEINHLQFFESTRFVHFENLFGFWTFKYADNDDLSHIADHVFGGNAAYENKTQGEWN